MRFSFWWAASCHLVRDAMGSTQQLSSHMDMSNRGLQKFIWYSFLSGSSSGAVSSCGLPGMMKGLEHLSYGKDCQALAQVAQGDWGISLQKPPGHSHGQKAVGNPAWAILRFCDFQEALCKAQTQAQSTSLQYSASTGKWSFFLPIRTSASAGVWENGRVRQHRKHQNSVNNTNAQLERTV